jgi:hypothetical protein
MGGCCSKSKKEEHQIYQGNSEAVSSTRIQMIIQGSGVLQDGTTYTRELGITETVEREREGVAKEVSAERMKIGGELCEVRGVRVNGEVVEEDVNDDSVKDNKEFETKWEEVNWRWSRILGYHMPSNNRV